MNTVQKVILVLACIGTAVVFFQVPAVDYPTGTGLNYHYRLDVGASLVNYAKYLIPAWLTAGILYLVCKSPKEKD